MTRWATLAGLVLWGWVLTAPGGFAVEYYVSEKGNDAWSGTLPAPNATGTDGPFRTLAKAGAVVGPGDVCIIRQGVYRETLRPVASGEAGRPIRFRAYPGEAPVLSGADQIPNWTKEEGVRWSAPMPWDLADQNQLFLGEQMLTEARWPNNTGTLLQPVRARAAAGSATTLTDPALPDDASAWKGALLWCAGGAKWVCWTGVVTGFDPASKTLSFEYAQAADRWYTPTAGSEYVVMGAHNMLDAEGEWWLDREHKRVWLIPPGGQDPNHLPVEAKRRLHVVDLSGRSHVHLEGLAFRAGGILTDDHSSNLVFTRLRGEYVAHSYARDVSSNAVLVRGVRHTLHSCEFAFASHSVLAVRGQEHRVVNCYVHHGNYGGWWSGTVSVSGRRHLISHNTFRHSGRDLMSIHGLAESLVQYNDLSHAGWLTHDLGMTYGHNTDFANTVIRYNWVHDNQAKGLAMGIYFDHLSHNVIVHHNLLWNITGDAIRVNNPSYFNLIAHNTCYRTNTSARSIGSFDHSRRQDLFGVRWHNNLLNAPLALPENAVVSHNHSLPDPGYLNPEAGRFELKPDSPA
ncbi:MAG: right-handed parallel beta-helix repeat-containing protein, partial [Armatimonadota bacterium]|nr:right-handed parallel beta-helix repeat-containing protein [Armatimonadota bacterium]